VDLTAGLPGPTQPPGPRHGASAAPPPPRDGHPAGRGGPPVGEARLVPRSRLPSARTCWRMGTTPARSRSRSATRTCERRWSPRTCWTGTARGSQAPRTGRRL